MNNINARLEEIVERVEKATKGPWEAKLMDEIYPNAKERIGTWKEGAWGCVGPQPAGSKGDAEFKAHSRADIPYLLRLLKSALAVIEAVQEDSGDCEARRSVGLKPHPCKVCDSLKAFHQEAAK